MGIDELEELKRKIGEIHKALLGDFENQGIVSRLRKLEDRSSSINKGLAVIATALVGLIINSIRIQFGL